eukprot:gene25379-30646_t
MIITDLQSLFGVFQTLYDIRQRTVGNLADITRLIGRCMIFESLIATLKTQQNTAASFPAARQRSVSSLLAFVQEVQRQHAQLQEKTTVAAFAHRLTHRSSISAEIAQLNVRLCELAGELGVALQIDEAQQRREDLADLKAVLDAALEEITLEVQAQGDRVEQRLAELQGSVVTSFQRIVVDFFAARGRVLTSQERLATKQYAAEAERRLEARPAEIVSGVVREGSEGAGEGKGQAERKSRLRGDEEKARQLDGKSKGTDAVAEDQAEANRKGGPREDEEKKTPQEQEEKATTQATKTLYDIQHKMAGNQADITRLIGRCMIFESLIATLKTPQNTFPAARQRSVSSLLAFFQEVQRQHAQLQEKTVAAFAHRLTHRSSISAEIARLNVRLCELAGELGVALQIDEAQQRREDLADLKAVLDAALEEITLEVQAQGDRVEQRLTELQGSVVTCFQRIVVDFFAARGRVLTSLECFQGRKAFSKSVGIFTLLQFSSSAIQQLRLYAELIAPPLMGPFNYYVAGFIWNCLLLANKRTSYVLNRQRIVSPGIFWLVVGIDRDTFQRMAPDHYTLSLFNPIKDQSEVISPVRLLLFASAAKDCFLTHDWGKDQLGRDNHARVGKLNGLLKERGFRTWFDEEMMRGDIQQQMADGIDHAACVIVFITERYMNKVAGKGEKGELDNCLFEFSHLATSKAKSKIFPVVMEPRCRDTASWFGKVKFVLGSQLYTDYSTDDNVEEVADDLASKMRQVLTDGRTVSERLAFSTPLEEEAAKKEQPPVPFGEALLTTSAIKLSSSK